MYQQTKGFAMSLRNLLFASLVLGAFPFVPVLACENLDDNFEHNDGGIYGLSGDNDDGGVVLQENTTGFCAADGKVETEHSGYSGAGFVNVDNFKRSGIEWNIDGGSGEYSFSWRYANGKNARPARLLVGGKEVAANVNFDSTGSWKNWKKAAVKVSLNSQVKRIRLEALTESGLANIDYMEIAGPGVKAVACQQDPETETETETETKLVGFAIQNGGTTGGAGGRTVTVTNAKDFLNAIADDDRLVIKVNGKISISGMHKVTSNKTIVGVGKNGIISGGGLNVSNASNVIIQNLLFTGANDDAINVQYSKNVWIDHCDLTDAYDGLVDIKRGSDFVTVSWNHFSNHNKTCLLGHSDSNGSEDIGHLRVTYHHNWFDHTSSRHPRVRFSELTHVYNNFYDGNGSYGIASTENAEVLVEGNYFDDVDRPTLIGYGSSGSGDLVERNNTFKSSGSPETRHSVPNPPYRYQLDKASLISSIVKNGAGRNGFK